VSLYLRLLLTFWRAWRQPRIAIGDTIERTLRVLPNDLDVNGHMNNGRYLTIVDLLLVEYFVRTGFARVMWRRRWRPVAGGVLISYRRSLEPLQTYTVRFALEAADAHWNYMRFAFVRDGRVHAAGYVKGTAVGARGLVPNAESYAALDAAPPTPSLPDAVAHWLAAERAVMAQAEHDADATAAPRARSADRPAVSRDA
jgi:acyl-CoA thioesterase FadM